MEYFDTVDLEDKPTGDLTTRKESHENGLPHRVAAVLAFHEDGRLYVQVHKDSGGLLDHTVGGHVSAGEDYLTAAKREAVEEVGLETGLEPVAQSIVEDTTAVGRGKYIHLFGIFKCQVNREWHFVPNDEVEELRLMQVETIVNLMNTQPKIFTYGFMITMDAYLKSIGSDLEVNTRVGKNWGEL